jgi:diguanylate cyclase (GGDEF)-like protein
MRFVFSGPPAITLNERVPVNRAMSYFWGSGGALVLLTVSLGLSPHSYTPGIIAIGVAALTVAAIFQLTQRWLPAWVLTPIVTLGSVCITSLMWFDASTSSNYKLFYVFAALYACYFFSPRAIIGQVFVIASLSALDLHFHPGSGSAAGQWVMIMGTVSVSGVWVRSLVTQVRIRAATDKLTGAANRQRLDEELPRLLARAGRAGEPVTVAMLDLDHFKDFNDRRGHIAGDRQLIETAQAWAAQLRAGDLLIRYGGEEFLAVLPACGRDRSLRVVERMRAATPHGLTCSAGIAVWDEHESATALLSRADEALYEAKRRGRNRSVVWTAPADTRGRVLALVP